MRRMIAMGLLCLAAASCGSPDTKSTAAATTVKQATATTARVTTTTRATTTRATTTTLSERQQHWNEVVETMRCPELADLEQKRLAVQFADQPESLVAIHDRQTELHCPQ
jgi:hypothetical protein